MSILNLKTTYWCTLVTSTMLNIYITRNNAPDNLNNVIAYIFKSCIFAPITEELMYRFLYPVVFLTLGYNKSQARLISSSVFSFLHIFNWISYESKEIPVGNDTFYRRLIDTKIQIPNFLTIVTLTYYLGSLMIIGEYYNSLCKLKCKKPILDVTQHYKNLPKLKQTIFMHSAYNFIIYFIPFSLQHIRNYK